MIIARNNANLQINDLWLCIIEVKQKHGGYYNAFPLTIKSIFTGKEWTVFDHQKEPHGTNHKYFSSYKVVADLTSAEWEQTKVGNVTYKHPRKIADKQLLININDDSINTKKDIDLLRKVILDELEVYLNNVDALSEEIKQRIVHLKSPRNLNFENENR